MLRLIVVARPNHQEPCLACHTTSPTKKPEQSQEWSRVEAFEELVEAPPLKSLRVSVSSLHMISLSSSYHLPIWEHRSIPPNISKSAILEICAIKVGILMMALRLLRREGEISDFPWNTPHRFKLWIHDCDNSRLDVKWTFACVLTKTLVPK